MGENYNDKLVMAHFCGSSFHHYLWYIYDWQNFMYEMNRNLCFLIDCSFVAVQIEFNRLITL